MSATIPRARLPAPEDFLTSVVSSLGGKLRISDIYRRWIVGIDQCCRAATSTQAGLVQGDGSTVSITAGVISSTGVVPMLVLKPVAAPSAPASGYIIFCDQADGQLKAIDSSGDIGRIPLT